MKNKSGIMSFAYRYRAHIGLLVVLICILQHPVKAGYSDSTAIHPILIISSYNPEAYLMSRNISDFLEEYKQLGGQVSVIIENMNCKSFSEAALWRTFMTNILNKYTGKHVPSLLILLGQEAWASYLSLDNLSAYNHIPVLCGMASRNTVVLPKDSIRLSEWEPQSIDVLERVHNHIGGFFYEYDVVRNIKLILDFYPDTKQVAFISDNSYGGVTLQAYVKKEMQKFPDQDLILLDGREHSIYTIVEKISKLPEHTVILIGTWRVDKNEGYFMRNATYSMMSANPKLPAFSISSVGLGHWAIGGYEPDYQIVGKKLARQAKSILEGGIVRIIDSIQFVAGHYCFDRKKLEEFGFKEKKLPISSIILNQEVSLWSLYKYQLSLIGVVFVFLLGGFLITLCFYLRTKKLKDDLLESEVELINAKERAEESDRLKSAFLANMSHEIRTPLNAIVGFSNVLISEEISEDERKKFVEIIQINSDLLLRLINDILDISRLETGKMKLSYEKCDVTELCRKVLQTTQYSRKEGVEYVFRPEFDKYELITDVQRLQQILINLLSNANKFTQKGQITIAYREDVGRKYLIFNVMDTGCGIPPDKLKLVFDRFEKLNNYAQGTGLGLAISKIIVNMLGGEIWVDETYKEGANFIFTHPINHAGESDESSASGIESV